MSAGVGGGGPGSQDFELNLAPIIDCFTVLITFMLASAAFLSIGIFDAGIAAAGSTPSSSKPPAINITVELKEKAAISLKVTGKENRTSNISAAGESYDYESLLRQLGEVKNKWPDVAAVTLMANDDIEYKHVVKSMEQIRKSMPVVLLGGF